MGRLVLTLCCGEKATFRVGDGPVTASVQFVEKSSSGRITAVFETAGEVAVSREPPEGDRDRNRAGPGVAARERTGAGRDVSPAKFRALCNQSHARSRAAERYGLDLTNEQLQGFADAFRAGRRPVVLLRDDPAGNGRVRGAVRVDGDWIPAVYDPATHSLVTFLPRLALEQDAAALAEVALRWEGPPPDAVPVGTILSRGTGVLPRGTPERFPWLGAPDDGPPPPPPRYRDDAEVDARRRTLSAFIRDAKGDLAHLKGDKVPPEQLGAWRAWRDRLRSRLGAAHEEMRALWTLAIDRPPSDGP